MSSAAARRADLGRGEWPAARGVPPFRIGVAVPGAPARQLLAALIAADAGAANNESKKDGPGSRASPRRSDFRFAQRCIHCQRLPR